MHHASRQAAIGLANDWYHVLRYTLNVILVGILLCINDMGFGGGNCMRMKTLLVIVGIVGASGALGAQWFKVPSPRAPRTANGEVDLAGATPRLANGRPDLSGVWMTAEPLCVIRGV